MGKKQGFEFAIGDKVVTRRVGSAEYGVGVVAEQRRVTPTAEYRCNWENGPDSWWAFEFQLIRAA